MQDYENYKVPVETYCRVTGFFRPVSHYNAGKKEEFRQRVYYKVPTDNLQSDCKLDRAS